MPPLVSTISVENVYNYLQESVFHLRTSCHLHVEFLLLLTCCILDTSSFMSYTVQNCLPLLIECISVIAFPSLFPSLFPFLLQLLQQPFFIFSFMSSFVLLALWFPSLLISCTWPFLFTHPYYSSFLHE